MRLVLISALFCMVLGQTGCSVVAAASGTPEPDMSKVTVGSPRYQIESELGEPIGSTQVRGGVVDRYAYKLGDESAPGRAFLYLVLDVVTLCLWEYVGFPLEISQSGNAYEMDVKYDGLNRAVAIKQLPS